MGDGDAPARLDGGPVSSWPSRSDKRKYEGDTENPAVSSHRAQVLSFSRGSGDWNGLPESESSISPPRLSAGRVSGHPSQEWREPQWAVEVVFSAPSTHLDREYWLRNCQGFLVELEGGRDGGVVDEIEVSESGDALGLVVACGWFGRRRRRIAVADVEAIVPRERRLVVRPVPGEARD